MQDLLGEIAENIPKLEQLKIMFDERMANASPEERKVLQAKIHEIDFRMQELKDQAEVC